MTRESYTDLYCGRRGWYRPERAIPIYTVDNASGGRVGQVVAAVTTSPTVPDQLETLLRRLLPIPVVSLPPYRPVPSDLEHLLQWLLGGGGGGVTC